MRFLALLLLVVAAPAFADTFKYNPHTGKLDNTGTAVSTSAYIANGATLQQDYTFHVTSGTVENLLTVPNGGAIEIYGSNGKLSFIGAAFINLQNAPGDSVLTLAGTGTGMMFANGNAELRFYNNAGQIVLKRTGNAELTVFTDNGTGGGYLLMAPLSRTKAQLDTITPAIAGQLYYCSDCTTDAVIVSTGTSIAAFGRLTARTTKPN